MSAVIINKCRPIWKELLEKKKPVNTFIFFSE